MNPCKRNSLVRALSALLLLAALCACDLEDVLGGEPARKAPEVPVNGPHIVLKGVDITFNGTPLKMGAPIEAWNAVIGETPRPRSEIGETFFYDKLGIAALLRSNNREMVSSLQIHLNRRSPDGPLPYFVPGKSTPLELFQGYLEIEGMRVYAGSTVNDINKVLSKAGHRPMYCNSGINLCSASIVVDDKRVHLYASTDSRKYEGTIYTLSFRDVY
jgi:hypothetical protein